MVEGTTQGDSLAMAADGVSITPLFGLIRNETKQVDFPNDLSGAHKLKNLRTRWDNIRTFRPPPGYFPYASNTWLVLKLHLHGDASRIFHDTGIKITVDGRKRLVGFIGLREANEKYAMDNVNDLTNQVQSRAA